MPPAPALGGRVIQVSAPAPRRGASNASAGMLLGVLTLAVVATACWRFIWPRGTGQRSL